MQDWLAAQAIARHDGIALILPSDERMSFAQLNHRVAAISHNLAAHGIHSGDIVGLHLKDQYSFVLCAFAVMRLGAILLPLNLRLADSEIAWQIQRTACKYVISDGSLQLEAATTISNSSLLEAAEYTSKEYLTSTVAPDSLLAVIFTSGTSGKPKGAGLTYSNFLSSAMASAYRIGMQPDDRWLCILPLFHVGGLSIILRSVLYGTAVDLLPKFDVETVNRKLTDEPVTLVSLVPTMLYRLLEARVQAWNPKLRLVLLGGAAPALELVQQCIEADIPIATTYGLTESASQLVTALPEQVIKKPGSVGRPLLFNMVRVVNEHGEDCVPDEIGEIIAQGPTIMQGYYDQPEATAKTLKNGWLHTGDMGYQDQDGDLFIVQRRSDLIVTGGENVYPAEVEAALRQHPAVKEAVVVAIPDAEWGQRVAAVIVLYDGFEVSESNLLEHCRPMLAGYKIPRQLKFVDTLPQTGSGKIQRSAVKELFTHNHEN